MNEVKRAYGEYIDPSNYARVEFPADPESPPGIASYTPLVVQFDEGGRKWQVAFRKRPRSVIAITGRPTQDEFFRSIPAGVAVPAVVEALWLAVTLAAEE